MRISPDYAEAHANLGAALTPTDAEEAIRRAGEGRRTGAGLGEGAIQSGRRLRRQRRAAGRRRRSSSCGRSWRSLRRLRGHTSRSARRFCRRARSLKPIDELNEAARLEPNSGESHYQLGLALARAGRKEEAAAALRKGRELVLSRRSQSERESRCRRRPRRGGERRSGAAPRPSSGTPSSSVPIVRSAPLSRGRAGEARRPARRQRRLPKGARTESSGCVRESESLEKLVRRPRTAQWTTPARWRRLEDYIRQAKYKEVEALLTDYVKERPTSSWGWYALGYSQFAQQKIGESISRSRSRSSSISATPRLTRFSAAI